MAFTEAEVEQFIEALHNSADLRERARAAILSDDFQRLPAIVERLGERMDQLTVRVDQLGGHRNSASSTFAADRETRSKQADGKVL